jgi:transcriptional regulator with XRE-family HTH domain
MSGAAAIRKYRDRHGLTQAELARKLDVAQKTVSRWEAGSRLVDLELVPRVASELDISAAELRPDLAKILGSAA